MYIGWSVCSALRTLHREQRGVMGDRVKGIFEKVMWVGKATTFGVGLTVTLALVLGSASVALAAVPGDPFKLGRVNTINKISTLVGSASTALLKIDNNGTGPALDLEVGSGAPLKVNSDKKVTNLNADQVDDKDSTDLPVTTETNIEPIYSCIPIGANLESFRECAPVTVTVPTGKQYDVTVLSSFAISSSSSGNAIYCPRIKGGSVAPSGSCVTKGSTPDPGAHNHISLASTYAESATSSGSIGPLPAGTYTFSTGIKLTDWPSQAPTYHAHTTVMVRDVSAPGPTID